MFITASIGNTNTVIGFFDAQKLSSERKPTEALKTAADFEKLLSLAFIRCGANRAKPEGSILSSVVPQLSMPCIDALTNLTGANPLVVGAHIRTDLDFSSYTGLPGSDRIAVCAAAWNKYKTPCIVIDMGTATTFNAVDRNGTFLGGAILPGLRLGLEALSRNTAQLPKIDLKEPLSVIGHDTNECLLAGAYFGTAALVDGLIARMTESMGPEVKVILTGGNAETVKPFIKNQLIYEPDLLLEGLAVLYRENS